MADINVNLKLNYGSNPTKPLQEVQAEIKGIEGLLGKITSKDVFKGAFGAGVALKGLELFGQALGTVVSQFTAGIEAAKEAEQAQAAFAFAISDTETNVSGATAAFSKFADELSQVTAFEDEAIIKSGALIGTLTRLSGEGLQNATKASADLAAALGIDLEQASTLVAKAANGNTTAFSKLGIEIKKGNTDAETFANTLQALSRFQGAAEQKSQTFAGAQSRLANTFGNLQEELGNTIVRNQAFVNVLNAVQGVLIKFIEYIKINGPIIGESLAKGFSIVAKSAGFVITALEPVLSVIQKIVSGVSFIASAAASAIARSDLAKATADVLGAGKILDGFANIAEDAAVKSAGAFDKAFDPGVASSFAQALVDVGTAAEQGIGQTAKTATDNIKGRLIPALKELSEEQKKLGQQGQDLSKSLLGEDPAAKLAQQSIALGEARAQDLITEQTFQEALATAQGQFRQKEADALLAQNALLIEAGAFQNQERILQNQQTLDALIAQEEVGSQRRLDLERKRKEQEDKINQDRLKGFSSFFGNLSALQKTKSQELFAVGKAAAVAQATIDGYAAAQGAYKVGAGIGGPILGAIFAAAAAAAAAVNIANIGATNLATGITEVPRGFPNDSFPANLTSGERVLSVEQNKDLKDFMNRESGGSNQMLSVIADKLDRLQNTIIVNIGEKEVFNVLRDGINSGRAFA